MDIDWFKYGLRVLVSGSGIYGIAYLVSAIGFPSGFLRSFSVEYRHRPVDRRPWWFWPKMVFTFVAVGVVVYSAVYPAIAAIPFSWGSQDEDGDWQSTRDYIRGLAAFAGSLGLLPVLEKNAEVLVWAPLEKKARQTLADAIVHYRIDGDTVLKAARRNVEKDFGPEEFEHKSAETEWRDGIRQAILTRLMQRI